MMKKKKLGKNLHVETICVFAQISTTKVRVLFLFVAKSASDFLLFVQSLVNLTSETTFGLLQLNQSYCVPVTTKRQKKKKKSEQQRKQNSIQTPWLPGRRPSRTYSMGPTSGSWLPLQVRYPVWAHKPGTGLHTTPPPRCPAGREISNSASLQPICVQACPAALLDQTPLIETVLFMQENKETHTRTRTHTNTHYACLRCSCTQNKCRV